MASTYIQRTFSGAGNRKTWTMSMWMKRTVNVPSGTDRVWGWKSGGGNYGFQFDNDQLRFYLVAGGSGSEFLTNRVFRDTNGWYHIVAKCDTTQATQSDRFKLYINGVLETSFSTATYPNQNEDTAVNQAEICRLGCSVVATNSFFGGVISHVHFTDGYAYDASTFGSTDATTGEWKINTNPSITMGTNGFTILKDGNTITDQSANSNDFSLGAGSLTKTEDCPSNIFCTNDVLGGNSGSITIGWGNSSAYRAASGFRSVTGNIGASAGKYYAECKINGTGTNGIMVGFVNLDTSNIQNSTQHIGEDSASSGIYNNAGQIYYGNASNFANTGAYSAGDIIQLAMDIDNGYLYFGKNGTWLNSSVPTSGSTGTGGLALSNLGSNGTYSFATSVRSGGDARWNFGNGYFEVTAISSAGTNASNIGIFEYDVPAGYTALSTKGLNL